MVHRTPEIAAVLWLICLLGACGRPPEQRATALQSDQDIASGPQRLEWDQPALEGTDIASYRFLLRMDGVETELTPTCGELLQSGVHLCSADLPALSSGRHVLTVVAIHERDGKRFESRPSVSLTIDAR
jgi:hypothetical protein